MDLDGVHNLADFEVIEIIDDNTPYPTMLGIDWAFDNQAIINLKKKTMSFEGNGIRVIGPLDHETKIHRINHNRRRSSQH